MGEFDEFPLHEAAFNRGLTDEATAAKLERLLTQGTLNLNERAGESNDTPLILAAVRGKTAAVLVLLRHGAHTNIQDRRGVSALHFATDRGHAAIVVALLVHGADTAAVDGRGETARDWAVGEGHEEVAILLEEATKVKEWLDAVEGKNEEKAKELFVKMPKNMALYYTLISKREEKVILAAVDRLLEAGANTTFKFNGKAVLDIKNAGGKTFLDLALETQRTKMAEVILTNTISSGVPLLEIMRRSDISKLKESYPELWTSVMTSDDSKERIKRALEDKQLDDLNVIFNDIDVKVQKKLFHDDKIHQERKKDGKTLLQHLAERGDEISRQKEDFVSMLARIDMHIYQDRSGAADRVVAQLKESLESSQHLVAWIEVAKRKFPISSTKMYLEFLVTTLVLIYRLGSYLTDVGTDAWVTQKFHNFSGLSQFNLTFSTANMSALKLQVVEQCKNYTQQLDFAECFEKNYHANHQFEENQFKPEEWNILYILSLVHMVVSWPFFWLFAACLLNEPCKSVPKTCQSLLEVIFFPIATYFQQFWQNIRWSKALNQRETWQNAEKREYTKIDIKDKMETLEEKETLVATIEVSLESSFQFYLQTLTTIPTFFISIVGAYKSHDSFTKQIFSWQNFSILISFLAMARTFHRIRNLSKQNALSGKAAICNVLLTTLETTARILTVGIFLYLYRENLDALMAVTMYYGHVLIMVIFNIIFNHQRPTFSVAYLLGLLLNSLSSVFTYNHYNYNKLIAPKDNKKESKLELHQPTLVRQLAFYLVFIGENIALSAMAAFYFNEKAKMEGEVLISNGFGEKFPLSRGNFHSALLSAWFCQCSALILRIVYYAVHPSSVSIKDFKAKNQIYVLGKPRNYCCSGVFVRADGQTGGIKTAEQTLPLPPPPPPLPSIPSPTKKQDVARGNLILMAPEDREGLEMEELTRAKEDATGGTFNRTDGAEGKEEKESSFTEEGSRDEDGTEDLEDEDESGEDGSEDLEDEDESDEDGSEDLETKGIATSETPLLEKSAPQT